MKPSELTSAYLWTSISHPGEKNPKSTIRINLRNTRNSVWRNQDSVTTTPDGNFHTVWADAGDGNGELRTATIAVTSAEKLIEKSTEGLVDKTATVSIIY